MPSKYTTEENQIHSNVFLRATQSVIDYSENSLHIERNEESIPSDDEKESPPEEHLARDNADVHSPIRMVGTIHHHHACKLCGHLRRGHICTNPNGKVNRLPAGGNSLSHSQFSS